jgi:hypothetical protein
MTPNVQCWRYLTTLLHVYVTCHFWTPICNVLGYWRHRSVCYTSLFTTSLVVTTISVYNELWPSDVVSQSGPGSSLDLLLGSSLFCVFDLSSVICSSVMSFAVFSLLCLYLGVSLFSVSLLCVCFYLGVLSLLCLFSVLCRPSNRVFAPGIEDTFPHDCISRCSGFPTIWLLRNS